MEVQHRKVFLDQPLELLGVILSVCWDRKARDNFHLVLVGALAGRHFKLGLTH